MDLLGRKMAFHFFSVIYKGINVCVRIKGKHLLDNPFRSTVINKPVMYNCYFHATMIIHTAIFVYHIVCLKAQLQAAVHSKYYLPAHENYGIIRIWMYLK